MALANIKSFAYGFAKMLEEQWQVDIRLKAGDSDEGVAISAHKLILAARSKVFEKMFEADEFKKGCNVLETVTLSELKQEELEAFVEFIYTSSLWYDKVKRHAKSLYIAADKFEIPYLRDYCRNELMRSMNTSNATGVLEVAQIPFDKVLHDAAFGFISKNFKTISNTADFKLFVGRQPDLTLKLINAVFDLIIPTATGFSYPY